MIAEVAAALDAAHARGLVHRDIKPGNILIEGEGADERVYLTDFGLARMVEATTGVTATGAFVGTLDYVAPEQIRGERVDARADVYALGCVLFELLTGNPPFAARDDKVAKMYAHLQEEPPRLRLRRPELPGGLDLVIARALAKDPERALPVGRRPRARRRRRGRRASRRSRPSAASRSAPRRPGPAEATTTRTERGSRRRRSARRALDRSRPSAAATTRRRARPAAAAARALIVSGAAIAAVMAVVAVIALSGGGGGDGGGEAAPPDDVRDRGRSADGVGDPGRRDRREAGPGREAAGEPRPRPGRAVGDQPRGQSVSLVDGDPAKRAR